MMAPPARLRLVDAMILALFLGPSLLSRLWQRSSLWTSCSSRAQESQLYQCFPQSPRCHQR